MLASSLIARFVGSSSSPSGRFLALYAATFAPGTSASTLPDTCPPPGASLTHARTMATTLTEWAGRLDAAGIQVHQEGAITRFSAAELTPGFGRHPGAVAARAKTLGFYADVLRAAVAAAHSRTYQIPAASWQGASVALTEATASAQAFHAARAALDAPVQVWPSDRPELAHLATQGPAQDRTALEREAGRAAAMHTTAMAEAIGCLRMAEAGPWLRLVKDVADLPTGCLVVGVEVFRGHPVLAHLPANLDPQHGGGIFGLGCQPAGALAACDAAVQVVDVLGGAFPASTRYVTPRMDPDALVAAMILSGRLPLEVARGSDALGWLAQLDSSDGVGAPWAPSTVLEPQTVTDHMAWGPVAALCLAFTRGGPGAPTLSDLEGAVWGAFKSPLTARYREERVRHSEARSRAEGLLSRVQVSGPVGLGVEFPVGPGTWGAIYAHAPIGVLVTDTFPFAGGVRGRKFTVACHRGVAQGEAFHAVFRRLIAASEAGWGGAATITGSPMSGSSKLDAATVVRLAQQAAAEVGIVGTAASTSSTVPTALR